MRNFFLLVMAAAFTALGESWNIMQINQAKQDVLIRSKRRWVLSTIELAENMDVTYPHKISAMFNDLIGDKNFAFSINGDGTDDKLFSIDDKTGEVYVHRPIDREETPQFHIKFDIWDVDTKTKIDRELAFDVEIQDVNDNPPRFINPRISADVMENSTDRLLPIFFTASDRDKENTNNSRFNFSIISQSPAHPKIEVAQRDEKTIQLKATGCFNYDKAKEYKITVEVKDHGKPQLSSTTVVTLNVLDANSDPPVFKQKQYEAEAWEMTKVKDLLRIGVMDKDSPNTDAWRAKYYFLSGNEEEIFQIETDKKTNEAVISIDKEKNYKITTLVNLTIAAENIERLCVCKDERRTCDSKFAPPADSAKVTIKMKDTNDPPEFEKTTAEVFQKEELEPGVLLYTPVVNDVDSPNFRFELVEDPAGWVTVDEKTGKITSTKKMDRESPFVDSDGVYKVVISAIDDGEPPARSNCTIKIHLKDLNDNIPKLVNSSLIMCANKENKIMVPVQDLDGDPFSGPFSFSLGDDKSLMEHWKLDPAYGEEGGLMILKALPYGNYSIPLFIQDQQNMVSTETLEVVLCDCGKSNSCRGKLPLSIGLGGAAIAVLIIALLLFFLLLAIYCPQYEEETFKPLRIDEGNQTLINYNQEGGGAACTAERTLLPPANGVTVTDGFKMVNIMQKSQMAPNPMVYDAERFQTGHRSMIETDRRSMSLYHLRNSRKSYRGNSVSSSWNTSRRQTFHNGGSMHYDHSFIRIAESCFERKLSAVDENPAYDPLYKPIDYASEEDKTSCQSLDVLSINNEDENLDFLDNLGPQFKTLGDICQKLLKEKNIQL